jgi:phosphoglycerate kinase
MDPVAVRLSELLGKPVRKVDDCIGTLPMEAIQDMAWGEVLLLENVRFHPEEEKNNLEFAEQMAKLADVYVNDAFGTAHRAHASTEGVTKFLPGVAGFLMEGELNALGQLLESPARPFIAVMGGAKVSDKIPIIANLFDKVDGLIIGGGMANTFLSAQGKPMGKSLVEGDLLQQAEGLIKEAKSKNIGFYLPVDVVIAPEVTPEAPHTTVPVSGIPAEQMALDIGPESIKNFVNTLKTAKTIMWNGPMGVFEMPPFAKGTMSIADALAEIEATTVIGGGDSVSAVKKAGVADKITHISTGGGASLEFLEGKQLPGVVALADK